VSGDWDVHLARAADFARMAHEGQVDKAGRPYIEHPARVAGRLLMGGYGAPCVVTAWLHDVVEDCDVSLEGLAVAGFPAEVVEAVDALTRRGGETYRDAVRRAAANPIARVVKIADNLDNSDEGRLALLPDDTARRLRAKYRKAMGALLGATA